MTSGGSRHCRFEELIRSHVDAAIHDLEDGDHIASSSSMVEGRQVEAPEPLLVWKVPQLWYELGGPTLDSLDELLIGAVKRTPHAMCPLGQICPLGTYLVLYARDGLNPCPLLG